jgi:hypothetical protein
MGYAPTLDDRNFQAAGAESSIPLCTIVNFDTMSGAPTELAAGITGIGIMELFEVSQAVGRKVIRPYGGP